jgi:hypothetical protein
MHWQTTIQTQDADRAVKSLRDMGYYVVSPAAVEIAEGDLGHKKAFLVSDPDGHVMQVIEK